MSALSRLYAGTLIVVGTNIALFSFVFRSGFLKDDVSWLVQPYNAPIWVALIIHAILETIVIVIVSLSLALSDGITDDKINRAIVGGFVFAPVVWIPIQALIISIHFFQEWVMWFVFGINLLVQAFIFILNTEWKQYGYHAQNNSRRG